MCFCAVPPVYVCMYVDGIYFRNYKSRNIRSCVASTDINCIKTKLTLSLVPPSKLSLVTLSESM